MLCPNCNALIDGVEISSAIPWGKRIKHCPFCGSPLDETAEERMELAEKGTDENYLLGLSREEYEATKSVLLGEATTDGPAISHDARQAEQYSKDLKYLIEDCHVPYAQASWLLALSINERLLRLGAERPIPMPDIWRPNTRDR